MPIWDFLPWAHEGDPEGHVAATEAEECNTVLASTATDKDAGDSTSLAAHEEQKLVLAARNGDQDAFTQIVTAYQWSVYRQALRMMRNPDEAADITQEVFIAAWRSLPTFRGDARLATWLHTITYHRCLRAIESQQHRMATLSQFATEQMERLANAWSTMQASIAEQQWCQSIRDQIDLLPQKYRAVLVLRHLQEQSYEEIAQNLTLSIANVKTHLFRARAMLREQLQGVEEATRAPREAINQKLQDVAAAARQQGELFSERFQEIAANVEQTLYGGQPVPESGT